MKVGWYCRYVCSVTVFTFWYACGSPSPPIEPPNIVWITSEDNSKHYLSLFDTNGIETPNIKKLADHGLRFTRAFSNAPVCSVARSTLISGCYAPRIGAQFHRKIVPVSMPDSLQMFPAYLREKGYYTSNNRKEDYNIIKADNVWDESSAKASWKNRGQDQPFFHVVNFTTTHESSLHFTEEQMSQYAPQTNLEEIEVQPNYPPTDLFKYTQAFYLDKISEMDRQVGEVIAELGKEGLLDNTFIFYFGDHGGVLPGSKGYLYETGLHVPLVVRVPEKYQQLIDVELGSSVSGFVSFVDFAPTVLSLAGVQVPKGLDGRPFLGEGISLTDIDTRDETFSYADRFDEKYDLVRALRQGDFKYIRSFQPFNYDGLMNNYRYIQLAYQEWAALYQAGSLNAIQSQFFRTRAPEQLFDIAKDPFETNNLARDPSYQDVLEKLRRRLDEVMVELPDLSFYPEHFLIDKAFENPVRFGQMHRHDIQQYLQTANLALKPFNESVLSLSEALTSADPWQRYWGLIVCGVFGEEAASLVSTISIIAQSDAEPINRVRAAECLTMINIEPVGTPILDALYTTTKSAEALLILNSVVLLQDGFGRSFEIELDKISKSVQEDSEVQRRLAYLELL